jgi:hypothetical protein
MSQRPNAWIALYSGPNLKTARLVAVSDDSGAVRSAAAHLLRSTPHATDPIGEAVVSGQRKALALLADEDDD